MRKYSPKGSSTKVNSPYFDLLESSSIDSFAKDSGSLKNFYNGLPGNLNLDIEQFTTARLITTGEPRLVAPTSSPKISTGSPSKISTGSLSREGRDLPIVKGHKLALLQKSHSGLNSIESDPSLKYMVYQTQVESDNTKELQYQLVENHDEEMQKTSAKQDMDSGEIDKGLLLAAKKVGYHQLDSVQSLYDIIKENPLALPITTMTTKISPLLPVLIDQHPSANISALLTTSDFKSPVPNTKYNNTLPLNEFLNSKVGKLLEELFESEITYVSSLNILITYYVQPLLIAQPYDCGVPIIFISQVIESLIRNHTELVRCFRLDFYSENSVIKFVSSVESLAIDVHLYKDYCDLYEEVLKIMNSIKFIGQNYVNKEYINGWQNYLEATQPISKHMDLSFVSLIQRPISRVSKYRLIIETIIKQVQSHKISFLQDTEEKEYLESFLEINEKIKFKLNQINENSEKIDVKSVGDKINSFLNFEKFKSLLGFELNLQIFGKALLCGVSIVVWLLSTGTGVEKKVQGQNMGVFLFKSHLIISEVIFRKKFKKYEIKFIIPLSKCQLFSELKESDGGLTSDYQYSLKIIYEQEYCQFEVLIVLITKKEYMIWKDHLETMINFVNGKYNLDYSQTFAPLILYSPVEIIPYDIYLDHKPTYYKYRLACYFKKPISINVMFDLRNTDLEEISSFAGYVNNLNYFQKNGDEKLTIYIRKSERSIGERKMLGLISKELIDVLKDNGTLEKKGKLKKSLSWSSLKFSRSIFHNQASPNPLTGQDDKTPSLSAATIDELQFSFKSTGLAGVNHQLLVPILMAKLAPVPDSIESQYIYRIITD